LRTALAPLVGVRFAFQRPPPSPHTPSAEGGGNDLGTFCIVGVIHVSCLGFCCPRRALHCFWNMLCSRFKGHLETVDCTCVSRSAINTLVDGGFSHIRYELERCVPWSHFTAIAVGSTVQGGYFKGNILYTTVNNPLAAPTAFLPHLHICEDRFHPRKSPPRTESMTLKLSKSKSSQILQFSGVFSPCRIRI